MKIFVTDALSKVQAPHLDWCEEILVLSDENLGALRSKVSCVVNDENRCKEYFDQFFETAKWFNLFYSTFTKGTPEDNIFLRQSRVRDFSFILISEFLKKNPEQGAVNIEKINIALFIRYLMQQGHEVRFASVDQGLENYVSDFIQGRAGPYRLGFVQSVCRFASGSLAAVRFVCKRWLVSFFVQSVAKRDVTPVDLIIPTNFPGNMQILKNAKVQDRHLGGISEFLHRSSISFKFLMHYDVSGRAIFALGNVLQEIRMFADQGVEFQNQYLSLIDYLKAVGLSMLLTWRMLGLLPRICKEKIFNFDGIDLAPYYLEQFAFGFLTTHFIDCYLQARSISRYADLQKREATILGYFEFMCEGRFLNYLLKNSGYRHRVISIQHAQICETKLPGVYIPGEIARTEAETKYKISGPDVFLVHGHQYQSLLMEFFPLERSQIVGCLKYTDFPAIKVKAPSVTVKNQIAIFTSTEDYHLLLELAKDLVQKGRQVLVKPHPANLLNSEYLTAVEKFGLNLFKGGPYEAMLESSHIVSGYSSISLEALYFDKKVCRYFSYFRFPLFAKDEGIPVLRSTNDVLSWMDGRVELKADKNIFNRYFSEYTGRQFERVIEEIKNFMART